MAVKIKKRADITPAMTSKVRDCAASGCTFAQTALIMDLDETSLRRWLAKPYNEGKAQAIGRAGAMIFNLGMGDEKAGRRPNLGALIFYLKCQGGWRETTGIVFEDAKPTEANATALVDLLEARFKRLGATAKTIENDAT